jgi:short-subunit dehydrogenase
MSRAAVRSMAAALRQELRLGRVRGVAVTTMLAPSVDTPLHRVAANHSGRAVRPMRPIYPAERVAATILRQLRRPRLEVVAGGPLAKALTHGHALVPGLTEWLVAEEARRSLRGPGRGAPRTGVDGVPATSGNLYRPASEPGTASGD